jgi:hypothetical protein
MITSQPTPVMLTDTAVKAVPSCGSYEFHPSFPHVMFRRNKHELRGLPTFLAKILRLQF